MIPRETIEEIRNKSDIVGVVSEYVALKKSGRSYVGLCPFHSEKGPSFTVSQEKQLFHCFGCGEGGNVFDFLMKIENISFVEAVAELGGRIGIRVEKSGIPGSLKNEKDKLYEVMLMAAKFFRKCLEDETGKIARDYLSSRGISPDTSKSFGLGFAPAAWDELFKHLISRGVSPAHIEQAGLTLPRENKDGYYDRFRNRLMFPIIEPRGRVIAFSGRALENVEPKYMNSPETPVYHKGETIFGLNLTKDAIKNEKSVVLVEGNVDLLSVYQAGVKNAAAPLGTALTISQCKLLARFTDTILLAYDSDTAGETAAERSAELLRSQNYKVKIIELSGAKDPDDFIRHNEAGAFKNAIDKSLPFLEFMIRRALSRHNLKEIEGRSLALRAAAEILSREKDDFIRKEYAKTVSVRLGVGPETVLAEIKRLGYYSRAGGKDLRRITEKPPSKVAEAEKKLIALSVQDNKALETVKKELKPDSFFNPDARAVIELLFSADTEQTDNLPHFMVENLTSGSAKNFLTRALLDESPEKSGQILEDCIQVIKAESVRNRIDVLKSELRKAEEQKEPQRAAELLVAIKNEIS